SREAVDVIGACEARLQALAEHYGRDARTYLDALHSWHHHLLGLFSMAFGADTRITRDGELSLCATTGSGFVYAIIFHGHLRHCTFPCRPAPRRLRPSIVECPGHDTGPLHDPTLGHTRRRAPPRLPVPRQPDPTPA